MNLVTNLNQNNNTLPAVKDHKDLKQAVDAKELYKALGLNTTQWARWSASNIENNPFAVEGLDFEAFAIMSNGREFSNYLLSIDFAKKLAMQVRTEEGEQVRDYFLECEDRAKQVANPQPVLPATYIEALEALIGSEKQKLEISYQLEEAKKEIAVAAPKVEHFNITMDSNNTTKASTVAGYLGIGVQTLNDILEYKGWYYKKVTGRAREFKQNVVTSGLGKKLQIKYNVQQSVFTAKGVAAIVALLKTEDGVALINRFEPKSEKEARARRARKEAKEALQCPERVEHTQNTIKYIETILKQA